MSKLKAAIIGVGNMGRNHLRVLAETNQVQVVAICDSDEKTLKRYKFKGFKDYKTLIENEKPNLVSICVPTSMHYEIGKYCLEKEIHTLIEKPISDTIENAEDLLKTSQKNNVKLFIGHIERFNPVIKKIRKMVNDGKLGKIIALTLRRVGGFPEQVKDSNIEIDLAIHDIDLSNYLLDELPSEINSNSQKIHIEKRSDSVEFFLKYKNSSSYIQANWITPVKIRKLTITGSEGYLEADLITQKIEFYESNYEKFLNPTVNYSDYILKFGKPKKFAISVNKKEPLKEEILYFIKCIKNNVDIDNQFAIDSLKIALNKSQWSRKKGSLSQEPAVLRQPIS